MDCTREHGRASRARVDGPGGYRRGRLAQSHRLTLDHHSVAIIRGHQEGKLRRLIKAREHAYVFHGHTHRRSDRRLGPARVINPGPLGGMRWRQRSFFVLDLESGEAEFIKI